MFLKRRVAIMYSSKIFIHSFISSFGISFLIASTKNKSESKLSVQGRSNSHTHTQKSQWSLLEFSNATTIAVIVNQPGGVPCHTLKIKTKCPDFGRKCPDNIPGCAPEQV